MIIDINVSDNLYSFLIYLETGICCNKATHKAFNAQVIQCWHFLNDFQLISNVGKHKSETILEIVLQSLVGFKYFYVYKSLCFVWFHANSIHVECDGL